MHQSISTLQRTELCGKIDEVCSGEDSKSETTDRGKWGPYGTKRGDFSNRLSRINPDSGTGSQHLERRKERPVIEISCPVNTIRPRGVRDRSHRGQRMRDPSSWMVSTGGTRLDN